MGQLYRKFLIFVIRWLQNVINLIETLVIFGSIFCLQKHIVVKFFSSSILEKDVFFVTDEK